MAEFIEVARAKRRMCKAHTGECSECKLQEKCLLFNVCAYSDDDVKKLENEVTAWAAEHPEPVYPTWGEWLNEQAVVIKIIDNGALIFEPDAKMRQPIPADIAEKLGIEPKEG